MSFISTIGLKFEASITVIQFVGSYILIKGSSIFIDIITSVQTYAFSLPPLPSLKAYAKNADLILIIIHASIGPYLIHRKFFVFIINNNAQISN